MIIIDIMSTSDIIIFFYYRCNFISNSITTNLIDIQYDVLCISDPDNYPRHVVIFNESLFSHTNYYNYHKLFNVSLLSLLLYSDCPNYALHVNFNNMTFYENKNTLLKVETDLETPCLSQYHSSYMISTTGYFVAEYNTAQTLLSLHCGQIHFNGITKFIKNEVMSEVIYLSFTMLKFSHNIVFDNNRCEQLISLDCEQCYLVLSGSANLTILHNSIRNQLIQVPIRNNYPYPYCLFQYYSPINNQFNDFQINLYFNRWLNKIYHSIRKLTSHCKWVRGASFPNNTPLIVNNDIINLKRENPQSLFHLGDHNTVCYCPSSSHYNCSIDQLGPVYPGENLTVDLCLPYNKEMVGIMYVETHNDNLPLSTCKIYEHGSMRHAFNQNQSKPVHFPIASHNPAVCELFLTAQPNLFTSYDAFYVYLLPCPIGFTLQHGICDCDPDLRKYIDECMISSQTVRRLSNTYILGINSTKQYKVSTDCPTYYCLQGTTWINLHHLDDQCQPRRTGLLCSQCTEGYSVVFGSNKCRKCSNLHLLYIIYIMFIGLLLIVILFLLNFTVTTGTINGLILYVNMISINSPFFLLQLQTFLYSYITTTNIGPSFEMCFYNGMSMYAKIWIQLTYPIYLVVIAALFIIGSRYSTKLYRLTFNRALPVLATLFMLTYSNILQAIARAPLYTTIITIPSHSSKTLWLLDPTIPLFGWKFSLLICVCLLLFLILLILNAILLFTKPLMRFKIIHRFKPLIDAFQGPFKTQYYYWIGVQLLIRNVIVLLSVLGKTVSLLLCCITIVTLIAIQGHIQPYKNKLINIQESLLLYNFAIMCILLTFNGNETMNIITINVMVGLSFLHFLIILLYHVFAFMIAIHCTKLTEIIRNYKKVQRDIQYERFRMEIPFSITLLIFENH